MSKIRLDKCVLSAKKLKCRIFSASFITKTKSTSKMSQANFLFYASMKMSRKIKKPMNWTAAKNTWRLFCCLFLYLTFFRQSSKCASHMSNRPKHCNQNRRNWHRICHCCQTWKEDKPILELATTLVSWRERKKIEMDFVTFIGFLATSQVFKADGWFMVLQGGSRALWSY